MDIDWEFVFYCGIFGIFYIGIPAMVLFTIYKIAEMFV